MKAGHNTLLDITNHTVKVCPQIDEKRRDTHLLADGLREGRQPDGGEAHLANLLSARLEVVEPALVVLPAAGRK
jgi:hypothetical protein